MRAAAGPLNVMPIAHQLRIDTTRKENLSMQQNLLQALNSGDRMNIISQSYFTL